MKIFKLYGKSQIFLFGNHIGYVNNFLHLTYDIFLKLFSSYSTVKESNSGVEGYVAEIDEKGFCVIPPSQQGGGALSVQSKVREMFDEDIYCINSMKARGLVRLKNSFQELPELNFFIDAARPVVENYYKSSFRVYSADVYRTTQKKDDEQAFDSDLFHFDNAPASTLKMMVYLTDVTRETGAISVVPKKLSGELKRKGFWDRFNNPFTSRLDENVEVVEAKAGTIILFQPQYCIHKATLPSHSYRDVAVFLLYPRIKTPQKMTELDRKNCGKFYGYLTNPFTWKPLRYGDE